MMQKQDLTKLNIKTLNKPRRAGRFLNMVRAVDDKTIANVILNSERLKASSLRSGTRQQWQLSPLLFNIVLEVHTEAIRQEEVRGIQIVKEKVKFSLHTDNMILHVGKPNNPTKKLLRVNKWIQQTCRIQNQHIKINYISIYLAINKIKFKNNSL